MSLPRKAAFKGLQQKIIVNTFRCILSNLRFQAEHHALHGGKQVDADTGIDTKALTREFFSFSKY